MRPETSEALARLVSIYVTLIERAGIDINGANINRIMTDPFAACESLNELAVKVGALDAEADAVIAAIYESMDAADARSTADEACLAMAASAWETSHVERPVPEPEPEPEPEAVEDKGEDAEQPEDKPKRRRRSKAKKAEGENADEAAGEPTGEDQTEQADEAEGAAQDGEPQEAPADTKPGRRARAKAKAEAAEKAPKAKRQRAKKAEEPDTKEPVAEEQGRDDAAPTARPLSNAEAAEADSLSVDQAVAILGVSRPTIYKLIESGELPAYKKGRSWRISAEAVSRRAAN